VLVYVLAGMVLAKLAIDLLLFVWTFFEVPGWVQNQTVGKVLNLLTNIGGTVFVYLLVAAIRSLVMGHGTPSVRPPLPFVRRPAPVHTAHKK
jgi:hypothetical protein